MFSHGDNKPNSNNIFLNGIQMGANTIKKSYKVCRLSYVGQ